MKLRYSATSPYVRKVAVTLIETGLDKNVERIPTNVWDPATDVGKDNPLGKVPALILDDGIVLYDSPVICEYLDGLHKGKKLFPADGEARWRALKLQALGDGMTDAGILRLLEGRRPKELQWDKWTDRQAKVVARAMDALEDEADAMAKGPITIGHIAVGCSLGWLDFRFPELGWRKQRPALADWYDDFADRKSMVATAPKEAA
ncbi:MAG: glutathione S-transferase N-terminal domain-containing protein [Rhodospirillales bacterium]|nr:glutathione S-transferase N-terminal domain-containing protein [Rhodospirillales bacterium]